MLPEVIFVHFSFLSASFADVLTKVANHPNTKGYSSEWQFRENFMGTGLAYDPTLKSTTTEKVIQYASGWRPITSSRNVLRDREARSGNQPYQPQHHQYGRVVQIGGHRDKPQPFKSWKRSPNRVHEYLASIDSTPPKMLPFPAATTRNLFPFSFVSSMIPNTTNILPQIRHNSYPIDRATSTVEGYRPPPPPPFRQYDVDRKKKSKQVVKEDDIVWMHYNSFDQVPKALPFMSNDLPEVRQLDQYDTDMLMQETQDDTGPFVVYSSSTGIAEPLMKTSTEDAPTTLTTPRPYHKRNSYEVIDTNNKDNFKPMTTTQRITEEAGTTKIVAGDEDEETWPNFHEVFYGTEDTTDEPATELNLVPGQFSSKGPSAETQQTPRENKEEYEYANSESKENRRLFNLTKSGNISLQDHAWPTKKLLTTYKTIDKVLDDERGKKSTKYFAKPIVITETAPEDEYFKRLLYDSFGGNVVPNDKPQTVDENANTVINSNQRNDENEIKDNATETVERTDNEVMANEPVAVKQLSEIKSQRPAGNLSNGDDYKLDEVVVKKKVRANDETWNFLLNVTEGLQFADLIPVTLKTNMFLVKKLIVECYSDVDETDSRGNTINCLKKITFKVLDRAVESDVVKITDSVSLVKDNNTAVDRFSSSRSVSDDSTDWLSGFLEKLQKLFSTHSLKVNLVNPRETENFQVEGRRRHRFRRVFPVVAGIYMTITAVVIPIVFQFMAMMGGKSFVISKLALLFALFSSFSRRRHYRRVFPIMVGAYMILSTVLIPLGFKFMTLLGTKSLLISKLSLIIAMMGSIRKYMGYSNETPSQVHYPTYYPYPSYYDPWRRDEFRKSSTAYDEPIEYTHWEEVE